MMRRQKPVQVIRATRLLWISLAVGGGVALLDALWLGSAVPFGYVLTVLAVALALSAWLTLEISRGRNWARIALLLLCAFGLVAFVPNLHDVFARSVGMGALSLLQCLVQLAALYLVFTQPASAWFRRGPA